MYDYKSIFIYGFAIFAMFFGSGNLVFPIEIGYYSANNWFFGFLGLLLSGIILPFFGLFVIKLHDGDYYRFFGEAGKIARITIPFVSLSLLGSFGVVPRCITVAHGGISYMLEDISLFSFAVLFSVVTFFLCLKEQLMMKALGKWMSPVLLVILIILIGIGVAKSGNPIPKVNANKAFVNGFLVGYLNIILI